MSTDYVVKISSDTGAIVNGTVEKGNNHSAPSDTETIAIAKHLCHILGERPISFEILYGDVCYMEPLADMLIEHTSDEENGLFIYDLKGRSCEPLIFMNDWVFYFTRNGETEKICTQPLDDEKIWFRNHLEDIAHFIDKYPNVLKLRAETLERS